MSFMHKHFADFGNHLEIPGGGEITVQLPEVCNKILFIFEPTIRDVGFDLMLNPDQETSQGDANHDKHFIHIPDPPEAGTFLEFDDYLVNSFTLRASAGSFFSYLGMITHTEPRTSYTYEV